MRSFLISLLVGMVCLLVGLCVGIWFGPELKWTQPGQFISSMMTRAPWGSAGGQADNESPVEMYDYPTIKWRAKPLGDTPSAIGQLWTTYDWSDEQHQSGIMKYRLTLFKAADKSQCEVQLLDKNGFKITQFNAGDFHKIPGAADITEARDSHQCTEDEYKRVRDYSIN
jgi:hypothetical protein